MESSIIIEIEASNRGYRSFLFSTTRIKYAYYNSQGGMAKLPGRVVMFKGPGTRDEARPSPAQATTIMVRNV